MTKISDPSKIEQWRHALVSPETSIRDMLIAVGKSAQQIALVVDDNNRLVGTITDGDIRRSIIQGVPSESPVYEIMHTECTTTTQNVPRNDRIRVMREKSIKHLPVVDHHGHVIALDRLDELLGSGTQPRTNTVILLAGGMGKRLMPLTDNTPKPLLHVGGRPILETIISQLTEHGFIDIRVSVNHLADSIKSHFVDGARLGANIRYLEESEPLGTAGPLGLLDDVPEEPVIVMNGDLLTKIDFSGMLDYHLEHKAAATVGVREYDIEVPFGVMEMIEHDIQAITEKPVHKFQVNAGIYILSPEIIKQVARNNHLEMPDLLRQQIEFRKKVVGFPIHEYWIDVGRLDDFHRASDEYRKFF